MLEEKSDRGDDPEKESSHESPPANKPHSPQASANREGYEEAEPRTQVSRLRTILFMFTVCSAQILAHGCMAQGLAPADIIAKDFGSPDAFQASWFTAAYSLTVGTFIVTAGRFGDVFGHRRLLGIGYGWLALWSLLAGLSVFTRSIVFFDCCRAMQGIGAALPLPNAIALLGQRWPPGPRKNLAFAVFGACAPNGFLLAAAFATLLAQLAWWPWAYWATAIFCCILCACVVLFIPPTERHNDVDANPKELDYAGILTGVVGMVLLNVSWNLAPVVGWGRPHVIVLLLLGLMALTAFIWIEVKLVQVPIIPIKAMPQQATYVLAIIAFGWSSFGIALYYYFQFVQQLRGSTPLSYVAQISPSALSGLVAALVTGYLLNRIRASAILIPATFAFCLGNIIVATMPVDQLYWDQAFWAQAVMPWGMDMSFPAAAVVLSNLVPQHQQGIAGSLIATILNYSISLGLGIAGTVASQLADDGRDLLAQFRGAWYAGIGLSACGILLAVVFAFQDRKRP